MTAELRPVSTSRGSDPFAMPVGLRVLVVDDNRDGADTTAALLNACGAAAETCYGGDAAVVAAAERLPDVCVVDLNMPGMDGWELAGRLRGMPGGGEINLLALTARDDVEARERAEGAGFDALFVKPVDPAKLLAALGRRVRGSV